MKVIKYTILLIFFLSIQVKAFAENYSPDQLVTMALKNSPLINSFSLDVQSNQKFAEKAGAWENPSFEVGFDTKNAADGNTKFQRIGISQTFFIPGTLSAKQRIVEAESEISRGNLLLSQQQVVNKVLKLIFELKAAKEKLGHAKERVERFKTAEGFLRSRVFAAPQKKAEASIVAAKLLVLQKEQFHIQAQKENIWIELNSFLKLSTEPAINLSWYKEGPRFSPEEILKNIEEQNPEIKQQNAKLDQSNSELDLARVMSWPGFTLSGTFSNGVGTSPEKVYGLGISLPLPLFDANVAGRSGSEIKQKAEESRLKFVKERIAKEFSAAFLNFELAKKTIATLPISKIAELEKSVTSIDQGFMRGQIDLLTYLEADTQHFESLSAILEAQLDVATSVFELQTLSGNNHLYLEN